MPVTADWVPRQMGPCDQEKFQNSLNDENSCDGALMTAPSAQTMFASGVSVGKLQIRSRLLTFGGCLCATQLLCGSPLVPATSEKTMIDKEKPSELDDTDLEDVQGGSTKSATPTGLKNTTLEKYDVLKDGPGTVRKDSGESHLDY